MSDNDDLLDDDSPDDSPVIRRLREQTRALKAQNAELAEQAKTGAAATRKIAFLEAGVDINDPKAKYFVSGYDGELDTDAIKQAAIDAGFIAPPEPDPEAEDDSPALGRILDASANGRPIKTPSLQDQIAAAEAAGDWDAALALKSAVLRKQVA